MVSVTITTVLVICFYMVCSTSLNASVVEDVINTLQQNINLVQDGKLVFNSETIFADYPNHPEELIRKGHVSHGRTEFSFKGIDQLRLQCWGIDEGPTEGLVQTQFATKGITTDIDHFHHVADISVDNRKRSRFSELEYETIPELGSSYNPNLVGEKSMDGIRLLTVEFIPKDTSAPGYSKIEVDIEPDRNCSVRRIRYEKNGKIKREIFYEGYRLINSKIWWPFQITRGIYEETIKGKEPQLWVKTIYSAETVELNVGLTDSYFEPQIPQGFTVRDNIAGIQYTKE